MDTQDAGHAEKNRPVEQPIQLPDGQSDRNVAKELLMLHKNMKQEPKLELEVQTAKNAPQMPQAHQTAQQVPWPEKASQQAKIPPSLPKLMSHGQEGSPDTAKDSPQDQLSSSMAQKSSAYDTVPKLPAPRLRPLNAKAMLPLREKGRDETQGKEEERNSKKQVDI